jgi:hypothetical protein
MSRVAAIAAKCKDCIHDPQAPGNWRQQVTACTITNCALWPYRPKSKGSIISGPVFRPIQTERTGAATHA